MEEREKGGHSDVPAKKLARQLEFTSLSDASQQPATSSAQPPSTSSANPTVPQPASQPQAVMIGPLQQPAPQQPPLPSMLVAKPDSPRSRSRPFIETKYATPKRQKQCNCKHSQCLTLYCECFASNLYYCDGCNCNNCCNNVENITARNDAIEATLELNPDAFRPKIIAIRDSRL